MPVLITGVGPTAWIVPVVVTMAERGYVGAPSHLRLLIAGMRPRPAAEANLWLRTLPGEQAQVDWGHFGHLQSGRARRPLMAFVMVLSHSRMVFLRFFLDARMDSFLRGHVEAFTAFNGLSRVVLYDNLKSAVLERQGDAIRFNSGLLALAGHYRFEPRPVSYRTADVDHLQQLAENSPTEPDQHCRREVRSVADQDQWKSCSS